MCGTRQTSEAGAVGAEVAALADRLSVAGLGHCAEIASHGHRYLSLSRIATPSCLTSWARIGHIGRDPVLKLGLNCGFSGRAILGLEMDSPVMDNRWYP